MIDSYYTSKELASRLINYVQKKDVKSIADFCVGDGDLLKAALNRWSKAKYTGLDISKEAITSVKKNYTRWNLSTCNFLSDKSRKRCIPLVKNKNGFDLILLNPPFSTKGGEVHKVFFNNEYILVSRAMAFLVEAIKYLSPTGCLYAILPISVAYSKKDEKIWKLLTDNYNLSVLETPTKKHFKGCSPNIVLISIKDSIKSRISISFKSLSSFDAKNISVFRGKVSMHNIGKNKTGQKYLIHTTNLQNNRIQDLEIKLDNNLSEISGPAILIPRVGQPNINKICIIKKEESYILSDCILAIKTKTLTESIFLKKLFVENWDYISNLYKGTGARYITIEKLEKYLGIKK